VCIGNVDSARIALSINIENAVEQFIADKTKTSDAAPQNTTILILQDVKTAEGRKRALELLRHATQSNEEIAQELQKIVDAENLLSGDE